jgi:DNA-binding beta-propeller fold protein YncE
MKFGTFGSDNGQFRIPIELAIDSSNNIYVSDSDNNRIQVFNNNGTYITQFGNTGAAEGLIEDPIGIALDSQGTVYVADGRDADVHVYYPIP